MTANRQDSPAYGVHTIIIAALACLQPGIDPVFLTTLTSAHMLDPVDHGWIVGATQAGMAAGAVIAWRAGRHWPRNGIAMAATLGLIATGATLLSGTVGTLAAARMLYGCAMGVIYTQAMASAAATRATNAYGMMFVTQLMLSTVVALLLPAVAKMASPVAAIAATILVPLAILALNQNDPVAMVPDPINENAPPREAVPKAAWALLGATFWFICTTMIVWSVSGALAIGAGISDMTIGNAVAAGSVIGVLTGVITARDGPRLPLLLCGPLAGMGLLAPLFLTQSGHEYAFILSVGLLNIGSTAIVIRCSGAASERGGTALFRRLVAASHSLGMIAGPVMGAMLAHASSQQGLVTGAVSTLCAACACLLLAALWDRVTDRSLRRSSLVGNISHRPYR